MRLQKILLIRFLKNGNGIDEGFRTQNHLMREEKKTHYKKKFKDSNSDTHCAYLGKDVKERHHKRDEADIFSIYCCLVPLLTGALYSTDNYLISLFFKWDRLVLSI